MLLLTTLEFLCITPSSQGGSSVLECHLLPTGLLTDLGTAVRRNAFLRAFTRVNLRCQPGPVYPAVGVGWSLFLCLPSAWLRVFIHPNFLMDRGHSLSAYFSTLCAALGHSLCAEERLRCGRILLRSSKLPGHLVRTAQRHMQLS